MRGVGPTISMPAYSPPQASPAESSSKNTGQGRNSGTAGYLGLNPRRLATGVPFVALALYAALKNAQSSLSEDNGGALSPFSPAVARCDVEPAHVGAGGPIDMEGPPDVDLPSVDAVKTLEARNGGGGKGGGGGGKVGPEVDGAEGWGNSTATNNKLPNPGFVALVGAAGAAAAQGVLG